MLSPYINPKEINNGAGITSRLADTTPIGMFGALDKRNEVNIAGVTVRSAINTAKSIMDSVANLLGSRSPYYIIGEIPKEEYEGGNESKLNLTSWVGGQLVRAVTQNMFTADDNIQQGVIIDCLGDVTSTISVKFTQNPLYYQTDNVIDSRLREPIKLRATVAVSNYLTDDVRGAISNLVGQLDPTGIVNRMANRELYDGLTRSQYALRKLRGLMESGMPFTVYTPHGYYENMLIQSITPKTNEDSMDMLLCDVEFVEAIMYMPYYNQSSDAAVKQAAGTEVTKEASGEEAAKKTEVISNTKGA